ncbi:VWA domain-containing protein [Nocardia sp. NBC_00511]|uniref:VWA domain-containing protein n=1 Tax=Nocardia sp. NBC_00511 TaxID=2903591 RepID=UPI00386EB390
MSNAAQLVKGQNLPVTGDDVVVRVDGITGADVSALLVTESGKVRSDADFVFFNQPAAPGVQLLPGTPGALAVSLAQVPPAIERIRAVLTLEDANSSFGRLPAPTATLTDRAGNPLCQYRIEGLGPETVVIAVELYRRGGQWKIRAVGQGYAGGFADLVTDHGVTVDDAPSSTSQAQPAGSPPPVNHAPAGQYPPPAGQAPGYAPPPSGQGSGYAPQPAGGFPPPSGPAGGYPPPSGQTPLGGYLPPSGQPPVGGYPPPSANQVPVGGYPPPPGQAPVGGYASPSGQPPAGRYPPPSANQAPVGGYPPPAGYPPAAGQVPSAPAVRMVKGEQALSLEKRQKLDLRKREVVKVLAKAGAGDVRARVVLVIDKTLSMSQLYQTQVVHRVVERMIPVAIQLDDDGSLEPYLYGANFAKLPDIVIEHADQWCAEFLHLNGVHGGIDYRNIGGYNNELPVMNDILGSLKRHPEPTLVLFFTDGGFHKRKPITQLMQKASRERAFWQFIGLGRNNFGILHELDTMSGRVVDNAGFFAIDDIDRLSDSDLYSSLLSEFPDWLRAAGSAGILR